MKLQKQHVTPLDPVTTEQIKAMLATFPEKTFIGARNTAILYFLADSGVRASELLNLNIEDVNLITGSVIVCKGKGRKQRYVFIGKTARKLVRTYLRYRTDINSALWVNESVGKVNDGERVKYFNLRNILARACERAGVMKASPHDFRRYFALTLHRKGVSLQTIKELLGHEDLQVINRYIKQDPNDLRNGIGNAMPGDFIR